MFITVQCELLLKYLTHIIADNLTVDLIMALGDVHWQSELCIITLGRKMSHFASSLTKCFAEGGIVLLILSLQCLFQHSPSSPTCTGCTRFGWLVHYDGKR